MITGRSFVSKDPRVVGVHGWCKERYGINHDNIVGLYDMRDKVSYGTSQNWYDISGKGNHFEQKTVGAQAALADFYRDFDGSDFMQQTEIDDETGVTFWPTYPGLTTTATAAKIRLEGLNLATLYGKSTGNSTHRLVLKDSAGAVISWGYIRGADSAEAFGGEEITGGSAWAGASGATPPTGWTVGATVGLHEIIDSGDGAPYDACLQFAVNATPNANPWLYQTVATTAGTMFRVSFRFKKGTAASASVFIGTSAGNSNVSGNTYHALTDATWTTYTGYWIAEGPNFVIWMQLNTAVAGQTALFDEFTVKEVTAFGTDCVLINSTPAGGTQSWTGTGSGDPNDPSTLEIYKVLGTTNLTGDMTVIMVVKPDDGQPAAAERLISKYSSVAGDFRSLLWTLETTGKLGIHIGDDGITTVNPQTSAAVWADGATSWTHIGFVIDVSEVNIDMFVNGSEVALSSSTAKASIYDNPIPFYIGRFETASYYNGQIGLVMVIEAALTATETANIAKAIDLNSF